ncbi:hypothetical protein [Kroppenstedtia guangzhouensis]|jgi:hypothetical protein|nr:hypothetical protein [Kroppenstedtia guangzhouensis]
MNRYILKGIKVAKRLPGGTGEGKEEKRGKRKETMSDPRKLRRRDII